LTRRWIALFGVAATALVLVAGVTAARSDRPGAQHVLLISVDGLHQTDLEWYVAHHPSSALAKLTHKGVEFSHAQTPFPSDSFPGMVALATGGNPRSTGVYYDDTWNRSLFPPGTTNCSGPAPGTEVTYFEALDKDPLSIDAGQGLAGLPGSILQMTGNPTTLIDPNQLPVDPATCKPIYPHSYLRVNTIFEVARAAGLRTAWSDKHPAYEILDGPSGTGVQDLFAPEINSDAPTSGSSNDWTTDNALTMQYDSYKVQAVLNEIAGLDHSGTTHVGVPAIFGMNFQTVSTAEKLPSSDGLTGGYLPGTTTPGPLLQRALDYVDAKLGAMVDAIRQAHLQQSTAIIVTAKHGQSPQDPTQLTRIDDGPIVDGLNAAWATTHPSDPPLVSFAIDDDGVLLWLSNRSNAATSFAKSFLLGFNGTGNDVNGNPKPYTASGLAQVYAGAAAASFIGVSQSDTRVPDVIGVTQVGVVYTGKKAKIAEHGGDNPADRDVPIIVSGSGVEDEGDVVGKPVETTQVAPTILRLLGLNPNALQAVQQEGTQALPIG
jgi:hypothetical protein